MGVLTPSILKNIGRYTVYTLNGADPNPAGSDIVMADGSAPAAGDYDIDDTDLHAWWMPMLNKGYRLLTLGARLVTFGQDATIDLWGGPARGVYISHLLQITVGGATSYRFGMSIGAVGQGGNAGGSTVGSDFAHYNVGGLAGGWAWYAYSITFGVAPAAGHDHTLYVTRSS